ncbi:MAG: hypothetical protein F6K11_01105 [Leptolyngbya sp. SIO3F4]|nr:hypothetical protein [Leptolyngbya sp. SIO3F4]
MLQQNVFCGEHVESLPSIGNDVTEKICGIPESGQPVQEIAHPEFQLADDAWHQPDQHPDVLDLHCDHADQIRVLMTSREQFGKLKLRDKYRIVKQEGDYTAARFFDTFHVLLYRMDGFYVEIWNRIGMNQVCWIEVVKDPRTLDRYLENIQLEW